MCSCFALVSLKVGVQRTGAANSESVKMFFLLSADDKIKRWNWTREKMVSGLEDSQTWDSVPVCHFAWISPIIWMTLKWMVSPAVRQPISFVTHSTSTSLQQRPKISYYNSLCHSSIFNSWTLITVIYSVFHEHEHEPLHFQQSAPPVFCWRHFQIHIVPFQLCAADHKQSGLT